MTWGTQSDRQRRIFLTGMFDMKNFGDLLFPLVARHRMAQLGFEIVAVSPSGADTGLADSVPTISLRALLGGDVAADGLLIGGGYIIHCHPIPFVENYAAEGLVDVAGPGLWLGATLAAAARDIPVVWNAPGVPHPLPQNRRKLADAALRAADYVSLRDVGSLELIAAPPGLTIDIVPDPIAGISQVWDRKTLDATFRQFLARKGLDGDVSLCAVHARDRSLAGLGADGIASLINAFCGSHGLMPVLIAVGQAHDDDRTAREISRHLRAPHLLLDDPASLAEIAAVLAHARLYVGSSLHGYIVAAAYEVSGVLVAKPSYRKFSGFLDHTRRPEDLARDWPAGFATAARRLQERPGPMIPQSVHSALDAHWLAIAEGFAHPERKRQQRNAFLGAWLKEGMVAGGLGWASLPFARTRVFTPAEEGGTAH